MRIIYNSPSDAENFDEERFLTSLQKYDHQVKAPMITEALAEYQHHDVLHVSVLAEMATKMLPEEAAARYYDDHEDRFTGGKFERLRRITGYLVGTLDRWNDAKKAEEHARVKHSVNSSIDDAERLAQLETQAMERNLSYGS